MCVSFLILDFGSRDATPAARFQVATGSLYLCSFLTFTLTVPAVYPAQRYMYMLQPAPRWHRRHRVRMCAVRGARCPVTTTAHRDRDRDRCVETRRARGLDERVTIETILYSRILARATHAQVLGW